MDIACPACSTRYAVPDSSIGVDGRVVRCAKCRHSWFQDGPELAEPGAEDPASPAPAYPAAALPDASVAPASAVLPFGARLPDDYLDPAMARDFARTPSSFAHEPPFRPRRNRATAWIIMAILLVLAALAAIGTMAAFGAPDWLPLPPGALTGAKGALAGVEGVFVQAAPDLVLDFPPDRQERRPLPNGSDFFNVSGTIHNLSKERRVVPTLLIVLRDGHHNIVYSLQTASPKAVLAPGESETVNQAIIDAPTSARAAEIGWKPG